MTAPFWSCRVERDEYLALKLPRTENWPSLRKFMNQKAPGLGNDCKCPGSQEPAPGTARMDVLPKFSPVLGEKGAVLGSSQTGSSHPQQSGLW